MFQSTDERLLRAAGRFGWDSRRLRIAEAVLTRDARIADVAAAEHLKEKTVRNEIALVRRHLHTQAIVECEMAAFEVDCRYEEDPMTVTEHAQALMIVTNFENEYEECERAVLMVGAY